MQDSIFKEMRIKKEVIQVRKEVIQVRKKVIIELLLSSYIFLAFFIFVIWKYIFKRPNIIIEYLLLFLLLLIGTNLLLNILSIITKKNLSIPLIINNFLMKLLFPIAFLLGKILGIKKESTENSYIELNSYLVTTKKIKVSSNKILILLPRCIQNNECKNDVVSDIKNCKLCGKCDIAKINNIIKDINVKAIVVTGGEKAREVVSKFKPKIIIAVACERELVSGMMDVSSFYVVGIVNIRPFGPCFNTKVSVDRLKETLDNFLIGD